MGSINVPSPPCGTDACAAQLDRLADAAEGRHLIGMAQGLVMAKSDCNEDESFSLLRRASSRENLKVREIARRMVEQRAADRISLEEGFVNTPPAVGGAR